MLIIYTRTPLNIGFPLWQPKTTSMLESPLEPLRNPEISFLITKVNKA